MQQLDPLMRKYGVSLLVSGHEHHYERSYPVYGGQRTSWKRGLLSDPYVGAAPNTTSSDGAAAWDTVRVVVGTGGRAIRERCRRRVRTTLLLLLLQTP